MKNVTVKLLALATMCMALALTTGAAAAPKSSAPVWTGSPLTCSPLGGPCEDVSDCCGAPRCIGNRCLKI